MTGQLPGVLTDIPLPPDFLLTMGYRGEARYVGLFWSPLGDQLVVTDGVSSGSGQRWAFLAYKRHRAVAPLLADADLGSSEEDGAHILLIDTQESRASVAPFAEGETFLRAQHPEPEPLTPEQQEVFNRELERLMEEWRTRPVDHEAIAREMQEQRGRMGRMMSFLDMCPEPPGRKP